LLVLGGEFNHISLAAIILSLFCVCDLQQLTRAEQDDFMKVLSNMGRISLQLPTICRWVGPFSSLQSVD
jgi:hypothetical protein